MCSCLVSAPAARGRDDGDGEEDEEPHGRCQPPHPQPQRPQPTGEGPPDDLDVHRDRVHNHPLCLCQPTSQERRADRGIPQAARQDALGAQVGSRPAPQEKLDIGPGDAF